MAECKGPHHIFLRTVLAAAVVAAVASVADAAACISFTRTVWGLLSSSLGPWAVATAAVVVPAFCSCCFGAACRDPANRIC